VTEVVTGNVYNKYDTRNPVARWMMSRFLATSRRLLQPLPVRNVLEVGCGEGRLMELVAGMKPSASVRGIDLDAGIFDPRLKRNPRLSFGVQSAYDLGFPANAFDLVVAAEVLEHLEHPRRALEEIVRVAKEFVLLSVPREPLWRALNLARFSYVGRLGNTPGHLQHWSRRRFVEFVESRLNVREVCSPIPWTVVLARKAGGGKSIPRTGRPGG
jgi:ubiquinone/menaquinone biosynthesis C-methylase UbiE